MSNPRPFVTITEQPAAKLQRFRYLSEVDGARSVGSIPGVNSLPDRKTYPTIRVHGHKGPFLVLLSLLNPTDNLVHPHAITGSDPRYQCRQGVIYVITEGPDVVFKNIGILCVKGKTETDVKTALKSRQRMNIDPFKAGFQHIGDHRLIDFTAVRLCFQVFLPGPEWTPADLNDLQKYTWPLPPVASDVVYDAKKLNDLKITYINGCAGPLTGGHEMTLLCEKYTGQNPDVVFDDEHGWTETASVELYHKQLAIVFKTPRYPYREDRDPNCADGYKVKVYLQQSTERGIQRSQPATLQYLPNDLDGNSPKFPIAPQASYLPNKLSKMRRKGTKPESSNPFTTPNTPSNMQPISPYQNIKQSPSSYQVTSPVNNAESDYSVNFDGEFGDTQHSSIQQMISSRVLHQNSITPNMNLAPRSTLNMNANQTMNTPPTITALHHAHQGPRFNANNNRVHRFTARIPSGTQIKRPKPEQNLSGELLPKRDKLMSPGFEHPQPTPSTSFNVNNKFNITNEPVPFNDPATDSYLPIKGGNIVNQNDPDLSNLPPDYSNIDEFKNMSEYLDSIWSHMQEKERNKTIHSIIQEAESWMLALPNLNNYLYSHNRNVDQNVHNFDQNVHNVDQNVHNVNQNVHNVDQNVHNVDQNVHNVDQNDMFNIYQNVMPNVDQNIANHRIDARDDEEESMSEELRRMIL